MQFAKIMLQRFIPVKFDGSCYACSGYGGGGNSSSSSSNSSKSSSSSYTNNYKKMKKIMYVPLSEMFAQTGVYQKLDFKSFEANARTVLLKLLFHLNVINKYVL
jgi:hypothetical protein